MNLYGMRSLQGAHTYDQIQTSPVRTQAQTKKIEVSDGSTWQLPPPFAQLPDWEYSPPKEVMCQGINVMAPSAYANPSWQCADLYPPGSAERAAANIALLPPRWRAPQPQPAPPPWVASAGHLRRAPMAVNGHHLFPTPTSSLLHKEAKERRDAHLVRELRKLEKSCESFEPDIFPVGYDGELGIALPLERSSGYRRDPTKSSKLAVGQMALGRSEATLREMRSAVGRAVASPWLPGLGRHDRK